ncbi:hypothetical protein D9M70_399840 [compost metagenome]
MVELRDKHGGHAVQRGAAFLADGLHGGFGFERFAWEHHGGTRGHAGQHREHHAEAVVERHRDAQLVLLGKAHRHGDKARVVNDVPVRQRGTLGRARGAAGELHVDRVVAVELRGDGVERFPRHAGAARHHIVIADHARRLALAHADHPAQRRQPRGLQRARLAGGEFRRQRLQHLQVARGLERLGRDDGLDADLVQRVLQLGQPVGRVDIDQHQPEPRGGELRHHPFHAVGRPDADAVAAHQAERVQPGCQRIDGLSELLPGPAHALLAESHRVALRKAADGLRQQLRHSLLGQRDIGFASHMRQPAQGQDGGLGLALHRHTGLQSSVAFRAPGVL